MKHIRLFALGAAVVLSLSLLTACGGDKSAVSGSESVVEPDVSVSEPDVSVVAPEVSTPEAEAPAPEVKPEVKPEQPAPEVKPEPKPEQPAPEVKPEVEPEVKPEPEAPVAPAGVDLNAFYATIFPNPDDAPAMVAMDNDMLGAFYPGLTDIALKQKVAYMPMMTAVPCEIVMVECANAADVEAVKTIFKARIAAQVDNHFNYPMVIEAWETEAKVVANGNFVALLVISGMTDEVVANFNGLF